MNAETVKECLLLLIIAFVDAQDSCDFPIRRSRIRSSWQSSFGDGPTCFYSRNQSDEESVLTDRGKSHRFFHSADKNESDGGFHWFAVQLNEPVLIRSVTVKGREDDTAHTYNRVIGIEIWTSSWSGQIFSGDHCSSQDLSRQFNESLLKWRLCGVINRTLGSIARGENLTVHCINGSPEMQHLLIRRNVSRKESGETDDDVMSFADLTLQTVHLVPSAPAKVAGNSNFAVSCSLQCDSDPDLSTDSGELQLCSPSGSCTAGGQLQINRAGRGDSGNYSCRLGSIRNSTSVTVLYPPSRVSISVLNSDSCQSLSDLIVQFRSSASLPVPEHRCSADADGARLSDLTRISQSSSGDGSISLWHLEGDWGANRSLIVNCSAVQALPPGIRFQSLNKLVDREEFECRNGKIPTPQDNKKYIFLAIATALTVSCLSIVCAFFLLKMKRRRPQLSPTLQLRSTPAQPIVLPKTRPTPRLRCTSPEVPECSYMSLSPAGPAGGDEMLPDSASDCSVYIEIVADAD